jgi:hypothetical protein
MGGSKGNLNMGQNPVRYFLLRETMRPWKNKNYM